MTAKKLSTVKRIVKILLAAAIVLFLAVLCFFFPFYFFLPARKLPPRQEGELRLHILEDAYDCTIVEFPDGELLIVNAGDSSFASKNAVYRYVKGLNPDRITLIATDPDNRCVGGMERLVQSFDVKEAYLPAFAGDAGACGKFTAALKNRNIPFRRIARYTAIAHSSGAYAVCLSPYSYEEEPSDASAVLWLSYGGVNILLAGNSSAARQKLIADEYRIYGEIFDTPEFSVRLEQTDIVKVSTHGASGTTSSTLINSIGAKTAIVQCGNEYAVSSQTVRMLTEAGADIYRTDELDTIVVSVKSGGYTVLQHFAK